ncbi:hypothetical protein CCASEI_11800 [Corynebacterium casei LMG S-19264]|uniref:Uncharacterized protein n=2 Tax=Actinomycetes TaxID=1760 RepID=A0A3T0DHE1_BREAU|nr:hypothetical protein CCASEI_11800 [Corynebacterium casei LMG S-19264]AZT94298.1 hypothetical protein CXR23_15035 [Brevibacterium aurantiacum]
MRFTSLWHGHNSPDDCRLALVLAALCSLVGRVYGRVLLVHETSPRAIGPSLPENLARAAEARLTEHARLQGDEDDADQKGS